jgi:hypothetical protein
MDRRNVIAGVYAALHVKDVGHSFQTLSTNEPVFFNRGIFKSVVGNPVSFLNVDKVFPC